MLARGFAIGAVILGVGLLAGCEQAPATGSIPTAAPTAITTVPLQASSPPAVTVALPTPALSGTVTALAPASLPQSARPISQDTPTPTTVAFRAWPVMPKLLPGQMLIAFQSFRDGENGLYVMREDGLGQVRWQEGADPAWGPDGARLAFSQVQNNRDTVHVLDIGGNAVKSSFLTTGFSPAWSPDGRWLAFADTRQGNADIFVINADGSNEHILHRSPVNEMDPCWSPDGTRIAFGRDGQIVISGLDGSDQAVLSAGKTYAAQPAWSPDGTRIAFSWHPNDTNGDGIIDFQDDSQIAAVNIDGTHRTPLTALSRAVWAQHPSWSPDGSQLAFESNQDGQWDIYVMKANGAELKNLTGAVKDSVNISPSWRIASP